MSFKRHRRFVAKVSIRHGYDREAINTFYYATLNWDWFCPLRFVRVEC